MCAICEEEKSVGSKREILENRELGIYLRYDMENKTLNLRGELGSIGYTVPIHGARYCYACGDEIFPQ